MLRGGFADAAPVGDSALATALQRLHKLPERPDHEQVKTLMADFSPHRSLATMHLWTQPQGAGMKRYWDTIETPFGTFAAWVDEAGRLLRFRFRSDRCANGSIREAERNPAALDEVRRQVAEYSAGKRQKFEFELNAEGPDFDKLVWKALSDIPFGTHHVLWRGRQDHRPSHGGAGGGRRQWRQSHRPDRALPSGDRQRRQPDRLWRRAAAQAQAAGT